MPTIKGNVDSVNFKKSGTGAKGPWVMFDVVIAGQRFTGFGESWQKIVGQPGEFEFTEEQRTTKAGTSYLSRTLVSPRKPGTPGAVNPQQLQAMDKKLDDILAIVRTLKPSIDDAPLPDGPPDDVNVDDIPF